MHSPWIIKLSSSVRKSFSHDDIVNYAANVWILGFNKSDRFFCAKNEGLNQARTGIICDCDCVVEKVELSEEQATAVFRILQEALTNVLRHGQATRVEIKINIENGSFALSVSDNCKGVIDSEKSEQQSLGILGMRERAHIGGEIDIKGVEGKGTVVIVRVPSYGQDRVLKITR
jgi:signal transduction histidine kinase